MDKNLIHNGPYGRLNLRSFPNVSMFILFVFIFRTLLKFHVVNRETDEVLEAADVVTYALPMIF